MSSARLSKWNSNYSGSSLQPTHSSYRYRCSVGGEWKPGSNFSRKNLNALEAKVQRGQRVTPATTGMVCRDHSGEPKLELRCEGPCNKVKTLSDFSKSSRTNNVNVSCTLPCDGHHDEFF